MKKTKAVERFEQYIQKIVADGDWEWGDGSPPKQMSRDAKKFIEYYRRLENKKKGIIQKRREGGAVCHNCFSPDYKQLSPAIPNGKPNFQCNQCKTIWQYGTDGGIYAELSEVK